MTGVVSRVMPTPKKTPVKKASSRTTTTTTRVRKPTVIDLDDDMDLDLIDIEDVPTKQVRMFDEEFTIYCDVNTFLLNSALAEDIDALQAMFRAMFPEGDYHRFVKAMGRQRGMSGENMAKVFARLLEVAADRPTS